MKGLNEQVVSGAKDNPHEYAYEALKSADFNREYLSGSVGWNQRIADIASLLRDAALDLARHSYHGVGFVYGLAELLEGAYLGDELHVEVHGLTNKRRIDTSKQKS